MYEAYMKSINNHNPIIFIKETKRASRYKDQPSFVSGSDSSLAFDKASKKAKEDLAANKGKIADDDEDLDYSPGDEED